MAADVRVVDKGFEAILKAARQLNNRAVAVGFQADAPNDALDVAIYNEFGTRTAPPRPFMAQTATKNERQVKVAMTRIAEAVNSGSARPTNQLLGELGEFYVALIRREINSGDFQPNAASTKKRKKSTKPLVDTGLVLSPAVKWVLR